MLKSSSEPSYGTPSLTTITTKFTHPSKLRIIKNLVVVSVSWWLLFSAYDGLVMLQSTLNSSRGIGVISVSVQHACGCVTALMFPKYLIRKLGSKVVIIASIVSHAPYIAANFYPHWILMILTSVCLGAANPLLWAALCAYVNNLSVLYTGHINDAEESKPGGNLCGHRYVEPTSNGSVQKYKKLDASGDFSSSKILELSHYVEPTSNGSVQKDKKLDASGNFSSSSKILESTTARFFGFHGMVYNLCHLTSNLTSYFILSIGVEGKGYVKNGTCSCGAGFCNDQVACFDANLKPPSDTIRHIITTVYVVLVVLSGALVVVFLDDVGKKREPVSFSLGLMSATCKLMKNPKLFLLIPMMLYIGMAQGFFMGDYTQAYVGCSWGIHNVGLVAATFGATLSLASTSSGMVVKYVGRPPIFLLSAALKVATVVLLLCWTPDADRPQILFLVAAFFGLIIGSYWSQLRAFMGILFREDEEAAFGNYQLWHSVGACIGFGYSKYLCTSIKIYILLFTSTLAITGYLLVERSYARTKQK